MKAEQIFKVIEPNTLSIEEINSFTNSNELKLSNEYIEFIRKYSISEVINKRITISRVFEDGFSQTFYVDKFLSFEEFKESFNYFYKICIEEELVSANVSIIGMTNGRTCICIGVKKENEGQIFLWDGDFGVTKQAENLESFFDSLELDEKEG